MRSFPPAACWLLLALSCIGALFRSDAQAAENTVRDTVLILDASGSMWAPVGGEAKIAIAKRLVLSLIDKWPNSSKFALMAYGHRTKGDCKDIELLTPLGPIDRAANKTLVTRIEPKGRTPIADSLVMAAGLLKSDENSAAIVLVSDGIESCNGDPCAVAEAIKTSDIKLVADVIGFDIADKATRQQLSCIAEKTGGRYFDAKDASGLASALDAAASQPAAQGDTPPPPPPEPPLDPHNLKAVLRLSAQSDVITDNGPTAPHWQIFHRGNGPDGTGDEIDFKGTLYAASLGATLPPGDYVVVASYGNARKALPVTIAAGAKPMTLDISLDAGVVVGAAKDSVTGERLSDIHWDVFTADDTGAPIDKIEGDSNETPHFILPARNYVMVLEKGQIKVAKPFALTPGDTLDLTMNVAMGVLRLSATMKEGGRKLSDGTAYSLYRLDKMGGEPQEKVTGTYDAEPQFFLAPGFYRLTTSVDQASNELDLEIRAGAVTQGSVVLDAGYLKWGGDKIYGITIAYADPQAGSGSAAHSYDSAGRIALNAGSYKAIVAFDDQSTKEFPFTITVDEQTELLIRK